MPQQNTSPKATAAFGLLEEIREMLNDIAASATILGATPFDGAPAARSLATSLHTALLEYELGLAQIGHHSFEVRSEP